MKKLSAILMSLFCMTAMLLVMTSCSETDEPPMPYIAPSEIQPSVEDAGQYVEPDKDMAGQAQVSGDTSAPAHNASTLK